MISRQQKTKNSAIYPYIFDLPGTKTTYILLHGFLKDKNYWRPVARKLNSQGHRVIGIDLLGFGDARKLDSRNYTYKEQIRHISKTLSHLDIPGSFVIVGHSMGALIAARYAMHFQHKVKNVTLVNPPMFLSREQASSNIINTSLVHKIILRSRYRQLFWVPLTKLGLFARHSQRSRENSLKHVIESAELFDDLNNIDIPVLIAVGQRDRSIYHKNISTIDFKGNITLRTVSTGHHAPATHPSLVSNLIMRHSYE